MTTPYLNQSPAESATLAENRPGLSPGLSSAAVHLWWLSLSLPAGAELTTDLLSPDERQRASRLRHPAAARRFCLGRARLRTILGSYLDLPPQDLRFAYTSNGKPYLPDAPHLAFSLSHAGEIGLLAVAYGRPVGVDVELTARPTDWLALARRCLPAAAYQSICALPDGMRSQVMGRLWVCHEAFLKARGEAGLRRLLCMASLWDGACTLPTSHFTMRDSQGKTWLVRDVSRATCFAALVVGCKPGKDEAQAASAVITRHWDGSRPLPPAHGL